VILPRAKSREMSLKMIFSPREKERFLIETKLFEGRLLLSIHGSR
jgi:hypothetical protein